MTHLNRFLDPTLVERLNQLQLSAKSVVQGNTIGQHRSPVKGASIEFRQHRFYVPGDEPRRLDWRVLARTDRPYIKEYDEETNLRCVFLLDQSGSMGYGDARSKLDYAMRMVAGLSYLMLGRTESVGAAAFTTELQYWLPPHAGSSQLSLVIDLLGRIVAHGQSDIARAMHEAADRLERRTLIILLSDLFFPPTAVRQGLARLRHDGHEVIVMRVLHPDELNFPFDRWTRFHGLEGDRPRLLDPALARDDYLDRFNAHARALEEGCARLRAEFATFTTDKSLIESLTAFLKRRISV